MLVVCGLTHIRKPFAAARAADEATSNARDFSEDGDPELEGVGLSYQHESTLDPTYRDYIAWMSGETEAAARPRCGDNRPRWGKRIITRADGLTPRAGCVQWEAEAQALPIRPAPCREGDKGPIHKVLEETCRRGCEENPIGQTRGAHAAAYSVGPARCECD
jgi:hypothetical protein